MILDFPVNICGHDRLSFKARKWNPTPLSQSVNCWLLPNLLLLRQQAHLAGLDAENIYFIRLIDLICFILVITVLLVYLLFTFYCLSCSCFPSGLCCRDELSSPQALIKLIFPLLSLWCQRALKRSFSFLGSWSDRVTFRYYFLIIGNSLKLFENAERCVMGVYSSRV